MDEGTFQGEESSSAKFWGGLLIKGGGSDGFRVFLEGGGGLGKKVVRSMFQGGTDTLEYAMFHEQIYSNV